MRRYPWIVSHAKNLADPAFEPSDEDLIGLSKRAFAHVRQAHEDSLRRLRADIATAREAALERLRLRRSGGGAAR
jgi:hypothetical protein